MDSAIEIAFISLASAILVVIIQKIAEIGIIRFQSRSRINEEMEISYLSKGFGLHHEMLALVIKSKNAARTFLADPHNPKAVREVKLCSHLFTETLYKYALFIPPDLYHRLHEYKHLLQDYVILVDAVTSPEYEKTEPVMKQIYEGQLKEKFDAINTRFPALFEDMKKITQKVYHTGTGGT